MVDGISLLVACYWLPVAGGWSLVIRDWSNEKKWDMGVTQSNQIPGTFLTVKRANGRLGLGLNDSLGDFAKRFGVIIGDQNAGIQVVQCR